MPVVINILSNSGVQESTVSNIVGLVNDCFKSNGMNVRLVVRKINTGVQLGGVSSGDLNPADFPLVDGNALTELAKLTGGKGVKITFARTPWIGKDTPGWSEHRVPSVCVKDRGTNRLSAETLFHELLHFVTLCSNYVIFGTNTANAAGHAPTNDAPWGAGNAMATREYRKGTGVTTNQIDKIKRDGVLDGACVTVTNNPTTTNAAAKQAEGFGSAKGSTNLQQATIPIEMLALSLQSVPPGTNIKGRITLKKEFPSSEAANVGYGIVFDIDDNPATGTNVEGFVGVERRFLAEVFWTPPFANLFGGVEDLMTGALTPLPSPPELLTGMLVCDADLPPTNFDHQIEFSIPTSLLNFIAPVVPAGAFSIDLSSNEPSERIPFVYYQNFQDTLPTLALEQNTATPGQPVPFAVSGLTSNLPFFIAVDGIVAYSNTLDASGGLIDSFIFPAVPPGDTCYVIAQDADGSFGFSVLGAVPEPVTAFLALVLALLGRFRQSPSCGTSPTSSSPRHMARCRTHAKRVASLNPPAPLSALRFARP